MSDLKTGKGKCPIDIVPLGVCKGVARVLEHGAHPSKYARGNWYEADDDQIGNRYLGAGLRHLIDCQRQNGTFDLESLAKRDAESDLPEIDHLLCSLFIIRALMTKRGALPEDPGMSRLYTDDMLKSESDGWSSMLKGFDRMRAEQGLPPLEDDSSVFDTRGIGATDKSEKNTLIPESANPIYGDNGKLVSWSMDVNKPLRGYKSVPLYSADHDRQPRDVRNPCPLHGAYTHANPRPTRPGDAPSTSEDRAVPMPGPRFVVMRAEDVPEGTVAEYGHEDWCVGYADDYNTGAIKTGSSVWFNPTGVRPTPPTVLTHAIVDTRPEGSE